MAARYTKELLVEAALYRFRYYLGDDSAESLRAIYEKFYDERGRDDFRKYASVTPGLIVAYKLQSEPQV